jgi:hypothetical protein
MVGVGVKGQLGTLIAALLWAFERVYVGEKVYVVKGGWGWWGWWGWGWGAV